MKDFIKITILLLAITELTVSAQSPFSGFFKPVQIKQKLMLKAGDNLPTSIWLFRPSVSISAIKMQWVGGNQSFISSALQTLGTGISYQKLIDQNGSAYCQLAVNGLVLYNLDFSGQVPINLGGAITIGAFNNLISAGVGWDANQKDPFILLNISLNLNK